MEILLALAGIAGLALLVQSKPLPSEADFKKALDKWTKDPKNPEANLIIGKYNAFVLGDYKLGMIHLSNSTDKTLKSLGEHETDPEYTDSPEKQVSMADEWVNAAKKSPSLFRIFYDRASYWYSQAWPRLEGVWKDKLRERGRKLAASRPPGASKKALPTGWVADPGISGSPSTLDGNIARTGSFSVRLSPADKNVQGSISILNSNLIPVEGKKSIEASAYVFTDGTENGRDRIVIWFLDQAGNHISEVGSFYPLDMPFWSRVSLKTDVPKNAVRAMFRVLHSSKNGSAWIDDVSMKVDGKEMLTNLSFEEK